MQSSLYQCLLILRCVSILWCHKGPLPFSCYVLEPFHTRGGQNKASFFLCFFQQKAKTRFLQKANYKVSFISKEWGFAAFSPWCFSLRLGPRLNTNTPVRVTPPCFETRAAAAFEHVNWQHFCQREVKVTEAASRGRPTDGGRRGGAGCRVFTRWAPRHVGLLVLLHAQLFLSSAKQSVNALLSTHPIPKSRLTPK